MVESWSLQSGQCFDVYKFTYLFILKVLMFKSISISFLNNRTLMEGISKICTFQGPCHEFESRGGGGYQT